MVTKTDNHDVRAKLELRRYFLRTYHLDPPDVLDCCQGGGVLWKQLRKEFEVRSYWGVDVKRKKGRLKLDSVRILQQPGWPQNVVDVDTYGSPWKHWMAMLPNVTQPITVFLTIGKGRQQQTILDKICLKAVGITEELYSRLPPTLRREYIFGEMAISALLTSGCDNVIMREVSEIVGHSGYARYIGVRLEPKNGDDRNVTSVATSHTRSEKETEHV